MRLKTRSISYLLLFCLLVASCGPRGTATPFGKASPSVTSTVAPPEPTVSATLIPSAVAGEFASDGKLEQGWYWLDEGDQAATRWKLSSIQPGADIALDLTALATDADQTRGLGAVFSLSLEVEEGGKFHELTRRTVNLLNTASEVDQQGFICSGSLIIDNTLIPQGTKNLWVRVNQLEEPAEDPLTAHRLAFRPESLQVGPAPLPMQTVNPQIFQAGDFFSDGDFIDGWWWLRDAAHQTSATWNFSTIPGGTGDLTINFEVLATDRVDGARDMEAMFYLSYGPIPDTRLIDSIPAELVILPNISPDDDPVGYTCRGSYTILRSSLPPGTENIWFKISRVDNLGQNPIDRHVAFMEPSITFSEGTTASGDGSSQEQAILITAGDYSGSLDAQKTEAWYKILLEPKQKFDVQFEFPDEAVFQGVLFDPYQRTKVSSIRMTEPAEFAPFDYLAYVADDDAGGYWYLKVMRTSGAGDYQFLAYVDSQDEAGSGGDAGDELAAATLVTNGQYTGILMQDDPFDYYRISLDPGQTATVTLTHDFWLAMSHYFTDDSWYGATTFRSHMRWSENDLVYYANTDEGTSTMSLSNSSTNTQAGIVIYAVNINAGRGGDYLLDVSITGASACDGVTADADRYYTSAAESPDWNWLQDDGRYLSASWLFRTLPPGTGDYKFHVNIPVRQPGAETGIPEAKFYLLYGPIPAAAGSRVFGPELITLETILDPSSVTGYIGHGEFTLPRTNLGTPAQGFWLRLYRSDPVGGMLPVQAVLGVSDAAIKLCLGEQIGTPTSPPAVHPQATVSLDAATQILTSSTSIFVDPGSDPDGDGLNQNWETAAANAVNPIIEVDEEELWLKHRDDQGVVNFVRVYPWPSIQDPQYILVSFLETWSMDYGSGAQNSIWPVVKTNHRGDSERILMAWKVLSNQAIEFEWVYTSSHSNEVTDHSGLWHAHDSMCNLARQADMDSHLIGYETMCSALEYEASGRLKLYTAENKHGIYVNEDICNNSRLVNIYGTWWGENCGMDESEIAPFQWEESDFLDDSRYQGDGRWLWEVFNVGEPDNYLINNLGPYIDGSFNNEAIWSGNDSNPGDFCGGLVAGGDIPAGCSGRIGSKYEGTIEEMSSVLNAAYRVTIHTSQGFGGDPFIWIYDAGNTQLTAGNLKGWYSTGQTSITYLPARLPGGAVDHLALIHTSQTSNWGISSIEVTDLRTNVTTTLTRTGVIPPYTQVTIP